MKKLTRGLKKSLSHILHFAGYVAIAMVFVFSVFTLYIKVTPLDVSYLIEHLKKQGVIDEQAKVDSLYLTFDKTYTIMAKDIDLSTKVAEINIREARAELSRTSLSRVAPSFKRIYIENANIKINLDTIIANRQESSKKETKKPNYHALLKDYSYLGLLKWTKSVDLESSKFSVIYNNQEQDLDDINLNFTKTQQTLRFNANGIYKVLNNESPVQLQMMIPDDSDNIELSLGIDNINIDDTIKSFIQTGGSIITGTANTTIHAVLNKSNALTNIHGSLNIKDGFVNLPNLYNNTLNFKTISSDFKLNPEAGKVEYTNAKLLDKKDNSFTINGNFKYSQEPNLNITVKTDKIDLLDAFSYIPDLEFKKWLDENIYKGKASNVKFGFYGPIRKELDGKNGNPYFDIQADFEDIALTYLEDIPAVENAKGRFNLFKKNINIDIKSATHSQQKVKRGNVKIAPLFEADGQIPLITVKALSTGSIEDALTVLNNKLKLNQEELFKHYKGTQETQTTVELNLDKLNQLKTYNPKEYKFIKVDVRTDIKEVIGVDPIFKQRFKANDAIVTITEDDFSLEASGFMNENPFSIVLKEKLLEFGQHTDITLNANADSFLIKDYLAIPSFNLSGLIDTDLKLKKEQERWNFDVSADLKNSLVNFGLLNYTKPLTKKGNVSANGYFDMSKNVLNLDKSSILMDDFKASGYAKIFLDDLVKSNAEYKNVIVKDKTKLDVFSLKDNTLTLQGETLDLRPFVFARQQPSLSKDQKTQEQDQKKDKQEIEKINVSLKKLYLNDDKGLLDVTILLNIKNTITGLIKGLDQKNIQNFLSKAISC